MFHSVRTTISVFPKIFLIPLVFVGIFARMAVEHNSTGYLWPIAVLVPLAIFILLCELPAYLNDRKTLSNVRAALEEPVPEAPMIDITDRVDCVDARWS